MFQRDIDEEGEAAPLLRAGRPHGSSERKERGSSIQKPAAWEAGHQQHEDVGQARRKRGRVEPVATLSGAGSRSVLLAMVAAVGAALLVIGVGFMSAPNTIAGASRQQRADTRASLATSPAAAGGIALGGAVEGGQNNGAAAGAGAGAGQGGGSTTARGGWRSQANRASSGIAVNGNGDGSPGSVSTSKPNVFFFLVDDMGFGDMGYQSTDLSEITPNLDALAAGGLSNYYTMTLCTPARASIMTGRYPVRYGLQYAVIMPGSPWGLPTSEKILPEFMNEAGYESHMVGKWHLGSYSEESLPSKRGFKTFLGYLNGIDTYYSHKNPEASVDGRHFFDFGYGNATGYYDVTLHNRDKIVGGACTDGGPRWGDVMENEDPADVCFTGTYSTDAFVGRAKQIVKNKTPFDEDPLFMYIAHQSVHSPTGPAPYEEFSPEELALLDAVKDATDSEKRTRFAGVLLYLDKRIGEFVDMLEQEGWLENSVIVVSSDNGACPDDGGSNYPLRGTKQSVFEGGSRVPAFVWSKSHLPSHAWGTTYDNLVHSTDWLPTLANIAGGATSGSAGALDGVDQWECLKSNGVGGAGPGDTSKAPRTELLYNWDSYLLASVEELKEDLGLSQGAFRSGDWKLLVNAFCSGYYSHDLAVIESDHLLDSEVSCGVGNMECQDCIDLCQLGSEDYPVSDLLYNVKDDPREEHDLYDQYPEIAKELRKRAEEVVFADWVGSRLKPVNTDSYPVWEANNWWMCPWEEMLGEKASKSLNGLM
ncbi:unnamed protein product [Ectocarpus sp. CCAP 1310/34]|nr:unnamed protein product [Ectocarpus sp. CCAP 1310/34]